jgi:ribosome maturation protein SDO1
MAVVTARLKAKGKHFELKVDLDEALKVRDGKGDIISAVQSPGVYYDVDKGTNVSNADLQAVFNSTDLYEVAKHIIQKGEVQKTQEFRDAQQEAKRRQIITILIKNTSDQHNKPYTEERLKRAMEEAKIHIDSRTAEQQIPEIVSKLKQVIPIKLETKRIKLTIPAQFTGQVYGLLQEFKESEEWLSNGSLQAVLNIPSGMQIDFYDKINHITHGAVHSEELPQKQ